MSSVKKEIGKGLRKLRELNGMTQKQLSEAIDMGESNYARVERGEKGISYEKLIAICKFLHATLDDVIPLDKINREDESQQKLYNALCMKLEVCSAEQLRIIDKLVDVINISI